jgi:hypothetical protein
VQGRLTSDLPEDLVRVRFPQHDFDGYWIFGGLSGCPRFGAVKFGVTVGAFSGYDWGLKDVPTADSDFCLYDCVLVGATESLRLAGDAIPRHAVRVSGSSLDVRIDDRLSLTGPWPRMSWRIGGDDAELQLEAEAQPIYWLPQMIQSRSQWTSFVCPRTTYAGTLRIGDESWSVSGMGCFDHPMGRLGEFPQVPGVGWWQWNGYALDGGRSLWEWKVVNGDGEVIFSEGGTDFPDGRLRLGSLDLEYVRFESFGELPCPVEWRSQLDLGDMTLSYDVRAEGADAAKQPLERGAALPNLLLHVDGAATGAGDGRLRGTGTGETTICRRSPATNERQEPW